jgi:hypothetical protein
VVTWIDEVQLCHFPIDHRTSLVCSSMVHKSADKNPQVFFVNNSNQTHVWETFTSKKLRASAMNELKKTHQQGREEGERKV